MRARTGEGGVSYDCVSIGLHWATVALVAAMFLLALVPGVVKGSVDLHKALGFVVFALDAARTVWRIAGGTTPRQTREPAPEAEEPGYFADASVAGSGNDAAIRVRTMSRAVDELQLQLASTPVGEVTVTWRVMTLPSDLIHCIGLRAAMLPLDIAGDLIAGAGVASTSIGVDRLSQSVNTTSSATNSGYGARVLQFEREFKAALAAAKSKYRTPNMAIF